MVSNMPPKSKRQRHSRGAKSIRDENSSEYQQTDEEEEEERDVEGMEEDVDEEDDTDFFGKLDVLIMGDLFELLKNKCGSRNLSVLVYMIMRHMGHSWRSIDNFLVNIGRIGVKLLTNKSTSLNLKNSKTRKKLKTQKALRGKKF